MIAQELEVSLHMAFVEARQQRHEFITVEHLLLALLDNPSAAILFTDGWLWPGLLLLLAATPLDAIAKKLAALRMQPGGKPRWWRRGASAVAGAALLALAYTLARTEGWGCLVLAAAAILFLVAMDREQAGPDIEGRLFLAERKGMSWLLLPFAVAGAWVTGLGALSLYAAASFFWVQRHVHRSPAPASKD